MIPATDTNAEPPRLPRRPRFRPKVAPVCPHCGRLGPSAYSVHVGGLCVRLVADHADRAEVVDGVSMRPVELTVNGDHRWLWTRSDVPAMDVDDLVVMFEAFEPPPPRAKRRVVDGGTARRPEPVALAVLEPSPPAVCHAGVTTAEPAPTASFRAGAKNAPPPPPVPVPVIPGLPSPAWL